MNVRTTAESALDTIRRTPRVQRYAWRQGHHVAALARGGPCVGFRRKGDTITLEYRGDYNAAPWRCTAHALPHDLQQQAADLIDGRA